MSENNKRPSGKRPVKRKFTGNMYTRVEKEKDLNTSASSRKLKLDVLPPTEENDLKTPDFDGYRFIDVNIITNFIQENLSCKSCGGDVTMSEYSLQGLSSRFEVSCECSKRSFNSCKMIGKKRNIPEVNRRFTYAMRQQGKGKAGMDMFCCAMDLPPPVSQKSYTKIVDHVVRATAEAAQQSMKKAAQTEAILSNSSLSITVSGDGTWKTRGHTSQIGVCSVIGSEGGKVIDAEVMSSYCKKCDYSPNSDDLHECLKNHSGSAGQMEVNGMLRIFLRSEETRGVKYTKYIGDGDAKTFNALCEAKPYGENTPLEKIECVGHIQKRMGTRLRKMKKEKKNTKLSDGKPLSGKNRLTDKLIDEISLYYGNAIRQHKSSLDDMRKAIWAIYYHKLSSDEKPVHDFCPDSSDTWCQYNKSRLEGKSYLHKRSVPTAVMETIKPIFVDLSRPVLLKRCLGGKTQNANESFNSTIWKYCPKISGSGRKITEIATNEATVIFNEGCNGRHHIMDSLQLLRSKFSINGYNKIDEKRIVESNRKALLATKEQRQLRKSLKAEKEQTFKAKEGKVYSAGEF